MISSRRDINPIETEGKMCGTCKKLREKKFRDPKNPAMVYTTYVCGVDGFDFGPLSGLNRILCDKWIPAPNYNPNLYRQQTMEKVADKILDDNPPAEPEIADAEECIPFKDDTEGE